jgi:hypothetical protein
MTSKPSSITPAARLPPGNIRVDSRNRLWPPRSKTGLQFKLRVGDYRVLYECDLVQGRIYPHYVGHRPRQLQARIRHSPPSLGRGRSLYVLSSVLRPPRSSLSSARDLHRWISGFESGASLLATGLVQVFPCIRLGSRISIRGSGLRRLSIRTASDREHRERSNYREQERCFHPSPTPRLAEMTNGSSDQRSEFSLSIARLPSVLCPSPSRHSSLVTCHYSSLVTHRFACQPLPF